MQICNNLAKCLNEHVGKKEKQFCKRFLYLGIYAGKKSA